MTTDTADRRPRRAALRLFAGLTIPADLRVVGAHYDVLRNLSFVILEGERLPLVGLGCAPCEYWDVAHLPPLLPAPSDDDLEAAIASYFR